MKGGIFKYGRVCEVNAATGMVRVEFREDNIVSPWLPIVQPGVSGDRYFRMHAVNELVVCLLDDYIESGVVLGGIYDRNNTPDGGNVNSVEFSDGSLVEFDKATSALTVTTGTTEITVAAAGIEIKRGGESLKAILTDLLTACETETHTSASPGSPTTPPVNVAVYTAIKTRLSSLFS